MFFIQTVRQWILGRNAQDRFIFRYHDGSRKRSADPVTIERSLAESLGDDWKDRLVELEQLSSPKQPLGAMGVIEDRTKIQAAKLRSEVLEAVDKAFGVHAYSDYGGVKKPDGLIDSARLGLLEGYLLFCLDLVRLASPFVNARSRASPSPENRPTPSGVVSTLVEKV